MYIDKYYTNLKICNCYFCGAIVTPISIEDIGILVYNNVCKECDDYIDVLTSENIIMKFLMIFYLMITA